MQNIGLLLTYNEEDCIEEVMKENKKYFDKILVLDGSTDKTEEIIRSFDNVKYFLKEQEIFPKRKISDGMRQFLIEKAQELYGAHGWFTLLHGDEIFVDNPNKIAERAEKAKAEKVNWHGLNFYLHTSQIKEYNPKKNFVDQVVFYQPGTIEIRQFRNKPGICYDLTKNGVVPKGIGWQILFDYPVFKHYRVRYAFQKRFNKDLGFFGVKKETKYNFEDYFLDRFDPQTKEVLKFDTDFGEFTPGKRTNFLLQVLRISLMNKKYNKLK